MLPDEVINPICGKWAKICSRQAKHLGRDAYWELFAVGYVATKGLNSPKLAHKWAKFKILEYIRETSSLPTDKRILRLPDMDKITPLDECIKSEEVGALKEALLSLDFDDARILKMRFWQDMNLEDIGKEFNKTKMWAMLRVRSIIEVLKGRIRR